MEYLAIREGKLVPTGESYHAGHERRFAEWYGFRPSTTAYVCPRYAAGKRCLLSDTTDCICARHGHLLDHGRAWIDADGQRWITGEPYNFTPQELADFVRDLAPLGLRVSVRGVSPWNPGYTVLLLIARPHATSKESRP